MELPKDPRKIRERIRSYERKLRREKEERGYYDDGAGKRYLLGPLYLVMGDFQGAIKAFRWFEQEFSDDGGEPGHRLCWALALYRVGEMDEAARMLRKAMLLNLYLIPHLLRLTRERLDIWHGSTWAEPEYLEWLPREYFTLWDEQDRAWARSLYESGEFKKVKTRYIEIYHELLNLRPGPRRSQLVDEAQVLKRCQLNSPMEGTD